MGRGETYLQHRKNGEKRARRRRRIAFFHATTLSIYIMYLHNAGAQYIHRAAIHYSAVTLEKLKTDSREIFDALNARRSVNNAPL